MLKSNVIGIDLAKNILQVCHISKHGELISNKAVSRQKLKQILANQQPAIVAIEGCGSSHYWGRYAEQFGHDVRTNGVRSCVLPKIKIFVYSYRHNTSL